MDHFGIEVKTYHFDKIAYIVLFISLAVGGWAVCEFAQKGEGTPIPLDDPKFLVTSGPYLLMPNPMQFSGILLTVSVLLFQFHWVNLIYLLDVIVVVYLVFEHFEGIQLRQAYGDFFQKIRSITPSLAIQFCTKTVG